MVTCLRIGFLYGCSWARGYWGVRGRALRGSRLVETRVCVGVDGEQRQGRLCVFAFIKDGGSVILSRRDFLGAGSEPSNSYLK